MWKAHLTSPHRVRLDLSDSSSYWCPGLLFICLAPWWSILVLLDYIVLSAYKPIYWLQWSHPKFIVKHQFPAKTDISWIYATHTSSGKHSGPSALPIVFSGTSSSKPQRRGLDKCRSDRIIKAKQMRDRVHLLGIAKSFYPSWSSPPLPFLPPPSPRQWQDIWRLHRESTTLSPTPIRLISLSLPLTSYPLFSDVSHSICPVAVILRCPPRAHPPPSSVIMLSRTVSFPSPLTPLRLHSLKLLTHFSVSSNPINPGKLAGSFHVARLLQWNLRDWDRYKRQNRSAVCLRDLDGTFALLLFKL